MKKFKIFVPVFLSLVIIYTAVTPLISTAEDISDKVLRLHIIANSDSTDDQNIKLQLKNYFLENTADLFIGKSLEENLEIANENKDYIESLCNDYLKQYNQYAKVTVEEEYFATRVYDDFTLPAGIYNAIKIEIGQGAGHNWWCIVFPSVCIGACSQSMSDYLSDEEMDLVGSGYTPKFKIIEIYEKLKNAGIR